MSEVSEPPTTSGVIIAAGLGSRLSGVSTRPKCLTSISGRPLIEWIVQAMAHAGLSSVFVIVGHQGELVADALPDRIAGASVVCSHCPDWQQGNGATAAYAENLVGSASRFVLAMSDHWISSAHVRIVLQSSLMRTDFCVVGAASSGLESDTDDATKLLVEAPGTVVAIGKQLAKYNAIDTGVFNMSPALFAALSDSRRRADYSLTGGNRVLVESGKLKAVSIGDLDWYDVDTPDDLAIARQRVQNRGGLDS